MTTANNKKRALNAMRTAHKGAKQRDREIKMN